MSRHGIILLTMASAMFFMAVSGPLVRTASAQGVGKSDDPFGDIDLESLKKRDRMAPNPVPMTPPSESAGNEPNRADPIGPLTRVSVFDRAKRIYVGKSKSGVMACYFREEGDSHLLDIGVTAYGGFIRLETPEPREATPAPPLRVYAGKEITKRVGGNEYATGEYTVLKSYEGTVEYYVPKKDAGSFVIVAKSDVQAFLEMVARARTEFVVVQSKANPKAVNIVAIYHFKTDAVAALLSCAKAHVQ